MTKFDHVVISKRKTVGIAKRKRRWSIASMRILPSLVCAGAIILFAQCIGGNAQQGGPAKEKSTQQRGAGRSPAATPPPDGSKLLISRVLALTEDGWHSLFTDNKLTYQEPKLVLFSHTVPTACGTGFTAAGPFYCTVDRQIYLDLEFFERLKRLGAPGDMAQAYVIMHETGHHVQTLLGIEQRVAFLERQTDWRGQNELSVRLELQADCLAGAVTRRIESNKRILQENDIEQAIAATRALGDDTLMKLGSDQIMPDSFTHGSAEQRSRWFKIGFETGTIQSCNTMSIPKDRL